MMLYVKLKKLEKTESVMQFDQDVACKDIEKIDESFLY